VPPGTVVVHPGAAAAGRRWPAERFAAVVQRLVADGHLVALTGSAQERGLCEQVAAGAGHGAVVVLAGRTTLEELAVTVADAEAVVCNDTGIAHLATAFATPSVVLFGPSSPAAWGPPRDVAQHRVLWRGRLGDPHATRLDPGLEAIGVREVLDAVHEVLAVARRRAPEGVG
jgi:ADP-heptose:LPS heptosyltransferase